MKTLFREISGREWLLVLGAVPICFGLASLWLGRDFNWDLRNYHYYNAYAFLHGRGEVDFAPAQLQSFYNPVLDLLHYGLIRTLPSRAVGFLLGAAHGINFGLIFALTWAASSTFPRRRKLAVSLTVAAVGCGGAGFLSELGTLFYDNLLSIAVLANLLLLVRFVDNSTDAGSSRLLCGAGLVMGAAVGLKPVTAVYAFACALALVCAAPTHRWRSLVLYGVGGSLGGALTGGFWMWEQWSAHANPVFPYLNQIFQSPYAAPEDWMDKRFLPRSLWEYLVWPVVFSLDSRRVAEIRFGETRFALIYALLIAKGMHGMWGLRRQTGGAATPPLTRLLLIFFCSAFIVWMFQSSIYRYIVPLELLTPLCGMLLLSQLFTSLRVRATVAGACVAFLALTFQPGSWGRTDWTEPFFAVDRGVFDATRDGIVLMLGRAPTAYVIPSLPRELRFWRFEGNFPLWKPSPRASVLLAELRAHEGPLYVLFEDRDRSVNIERTWGEIGLAIPPREVPCGPVQERSAPVIVACRMR